MAAFECKAVVGLDSIRHCHCRCQILTLGNNLAGLHYCLHSRLMHCIKHDEHGDRSFCTFFYVFLERGRAIPHTPEVAAYIAPHASIASHTFRSIQINGMSLVGLYVGSKFDYVPSALIDKPYLVDEGFTNKQMGPLRGPFCLAESSGQSPKGSDPSYRQSASRTSRTRGSSPVKPPALPYAIAASSSSPFRLCRKARRAPTRLPAPQ